MWCSPIGTGLIASPAPVGRALSPPPSPSPSPSPAPSPSPSPSLALLLSLSLSLSLTHTHTDSLSDSLSLALSPSHPPTHPLRLSPNIVTVGAGIKRLVTNQSQLAGTKRSQVGGNKAVSASQHHRSQLSASSLTASSTRAHSLSHSVGTQSLKQRRHSSQHRRSQRRLPGHTALFTRWRGGGGGGQCCIPVGEDGWTGSVMATATLRQRRSVRRGCAGCPLFAHLQHPSVYGVPFGEVAQVAALVPCLLTRSACLPCLLRGCMTHTSPGAFAHAHASMHICTHLYTNTFGGPLWSTGGQIVVNRGKTNGLGGPCVS